MHLPVFSHREKKYGPVPGPPIPSFLFARPGEKRFLEGIAVIGRQECLATFLKISSPSAPH